LTSLISAIIDSTAPYVPSDSSTFADTTLLPIRAASTQTDAGGSFCKLQPFTADTITDKTYIADSSTADVTITPALDQCQGADFGSVTATVTSASVAWIDDSAASSFLVKPSVVEGTSDCCGTSITVDLALADSNSVPNTGSTSFSVTFTEVPVISEPATETSATNTTSYLDRDLDKVAYSDEYESTLAATTATALTLSVITGTSASLTGLGLLQCQIPQLLSMFDADIPDSYVEHWQAFSIAKLDFKFTDPADIQSSLADQTRRDLSSKGYKSLSNVKIYNQSFLVNYIFWFIALAIVIILHILIFLCSKLFSKSEEGSNCTRFWTKLRSVFEFHIYFHMLVYSSLFIFLVIVNEIAAANFNTKFNTFSFYCSSFVLVGLALFIVAPLPFLMKKQKEIDTVEDLRALPEDVKPKIETFGDKIWSTLTSGLKNTAFSRIYYQLLLLKFLLYACILILLTDPKYQIGCFVGVTALFLLFLVIVRPFSTAFYNLIAVINETVVVAAALMIWFIDNGDEKESLATVITWIFTANVGVCLLLSLCFQVYNL
jgi:hypothetical protein